MVVAAVAAAFATLAAGVLAADVTAAACIGSAAALVVWGAGPNSVNLLEAVAEEAKYVSIAVASCAQNSPYWASFAAIADVFCPKRFVATNCASSARFSAITAGGTWAAKAVS